MSTTLPIPCAFALASAHLNLRPVEGGFLLSICDKLSFPIWSGRPLPNWEQPTVEQIRHQTIAAFQYEPDPQVVGRILSEHVRVSAGYNGRN